MTQYAMTYLVGTLLGEILMLGWWGMQQPRPTSPGEYFKTKWAHALFSGVFALVGCVLWAEGKGVNLFGKGQVTLTTGWSIVMGALVCFFAHSLVWGIARSPIGKMIGLQMPDTPDLLQKMGVPESPKEEPKP